MSEQAASGGAPAWPTVRPDDGGIRPLGPPDECFYCQAKVGAPHGARCVCVLKRVRYRVLSDGQEVGTYERDEPFAWTAAKCEWHKNESSWCADNAVADGVAWLDTAFARKVAAYLDEQDEDDCACGTLTFRFAAVVVAGPFVQPPRTRP